jgi:LPXTG-motif cell wall-anchored protein
VTFLLFTGASAAHAADDDPDAAGTGGGAMVITVVVPDHTAAPSPSPSPTPPQEHTGALPATGDDLQQLLPWLLGGLAATSLGGVLVARRRRA